MRHAAILRTSIRISVMCFGAAATLSAQGPPSAPPSAAKGSSGAQQAAKSSQPYRFRLLGEYDAASGSPIPDVEVSDLLTGTKSLTTATGTVSLFFLPDGGSLVRVRKVGYEAQMIPVAVTPKDTTPITVVLSKVTTLPTVRVKASGLQYRSPFLQEAAKRMESGAGGYFIDEATLRKNENSTLANVLRGQLPGLMSAEGPHSETYFLSTRQTCRSALGCQRPDCYITVYIDGVQSTIMPDFSRMYPDDYAIVEYYPGAASTPAEYGGTQSPCGALLLWTRER